jgi:hypothetical protein
MTIQESSAIPSDIPENGPLGTGLTFRFLVAVDAEGFSRYCAAEQASIQGDLDRALTTAAETAGMDRGQWTRQPRGDGELAELPLAADGLSLVADFPRQLAGAISDLNAARVAGPRLRIRMAIHHGAVSPGRFGSVGPALVAVTRLLDSRAVHLQLSREPGRDVSLIVSAAVYEEVVKTRFHGLCPEAFGKVPVQAKGLVYVGYLYQREFAGAVQIPVGPAMAAGI